MDASARKRSNSPVRTRHSKRMILLDEENDDWRRTSSPSTSSVTSKMSSDSEPAGAGTGAGATDVNYVTEKFSGFLAEFLAEYASPKSPRTPESHAAAEQHTSASTSQPPPTSDTRSHGASGGGSQSDVPDSPAPSSSWCSEDLTTDPEEDSDMDEDTSTVADGESNWEDEDADSPGSPGSDIELADGILRRGMYITVVLSNRERNTALPCTAKVLNVHDRKGKFTLRLSKSARRATRTMWAATSSAPTAPRSPTATRGRFSSPRPS